MKSHYKVANQLGICWFMADLNHLGRDGCKITWGKDGESYFICQEVITKPDQDGVK